jgi:hypothetical protein
MWTSVSALLHTVFIGGLCFVSHLEAQKREAAAKAKAAEAAAQPEPTPDAAAQSAATNATPATAASPTAAATPTQAAAQPTATSQPAAPQNTAATTPAKPTPAPNSEKPAPPSAEKLLGIDKVAKPEDSPKGANPFSKKDDDLLKDLK